MRLKEQKERGDVPPAVPLFPLFKKDLYFLNEGNKTYVDGLVNFEKLRSISKEIRWATSLSSSAYVNIIFFLLKEFFKKMNFEMKKRVFFFF